ncbi:hypothetical protein ACGFT2_15110 [Streptomyces sp. NPDC048514]|uniref:hypothetical protein n=1 Tax=Streptomyces sp. NPDC048514 TaxID=3365564 RepID=UPI0037220CB5
MRLTPRTTMAGVCATVAAGAVLLGGGPATAATPAAAEHVPAQVTAADTGHHLGRHHTARQPTDRWIEDQLATFHPSAEKRLAVFDPWVKDQLAAFPPAER